MEDVSNTLQQMQEKEENLTEDYGICHIFRWFFSKKGSKITDPPEPPLVYGWLLIMYAAKSVVPDSMLFHVVSD